MKTSRRIITVFSVALTTLVCDQAIKAVVSARLATEPVRSYLNGGILLGYALNPGSLLGFGSQLPERLRFVVFIVLIAVFVTGLLLYLLFNHKLPAGLVVGLSLLAGGGLGNLVDRLLHNGWVVDYVQLKIGPLETGVFNLADVAILAGLLVSVLGLRTQAEDVTQNIPLNQ